jgi:hypothetical protein
LDTTPSKNGLTYAKNLLFTTDEIGLEALKNINFPTRIFPLEELDTETHNFAKQIVKYQKEFSFFTNDPKKFTIRELDDFIKDLHEKYP